MDPSPTPRPATAAGRRSSSRRSAVALVSAALLAGVLGWAATRRDAPDDLALAASAIESGRFDEAADRLLALSESGEPRALALLARARLGQGRFASALALANQPRAALGPAERGALAAAALAGAGRTAEARAALRPALEAPPDDPEILAIVAAVARGLEGPAAARPLYRRLETLQPGRVEWPRALGLIELETDRYGPAAEALARALALAPDDLPTRFSLAEADFLRGDLASSLAHLDRCVAAAPEASRYRLSRAECLRALGRSDEAEASVAAVLSRAPDDPRALRLRAEALLERNRPAEAAATLERAEVAAPDDWRVHYALSRAYRRLDRPADADAQAEKARIGRDRARHEF